MSTRSRIPGNVHAYTGYAVLAIGFVVRLVTVHFYPVSHRLYSDMYGYSVISDALLIGEWRPTHFFQPIGQAFVEFAFKSVFGANWAQPYGVYQSIIGTAALWFMWKAAEKSFGRAVGVAALVVGAFHIHWLTYNLFALSENTFMFLLAVLLWASGKVVQRESYLWPAAWGLVFITALWFKGSHVFLGPLFILGTLWWKRWSWAAIGRIAVPITAIAAAGLLLHGVLTYRTIGTFQMTASAGGLNLVEGKCPAKNNFDSAGASWLSPLYVQIFMTERMDWPVPFTDSRYFTRQALRCIQDDPMVLVSSLESIPFLFIGNFAWPALQEVRRYERLFELFFSLALVTGFLVWLRSCWPVARDTVPEFLVWGLPIAALFLCVYVFKSEIRFRIPFDVFFIPVSVQGWRLILTMSRRDVCTAVSDSPSIVPSAL